MTQRVTIQTNQEQKLTTNTVLAEGSPNAQIVFVGEAPGAEEDQMGRPFIGSAGQLLNRCLNQVGIIRSNCLVGNIFTQRPPRNNINYYFQDKTNKKPTWEAEEHIKKCTIWLEKLKQEGKVKLIVALGATSMYILTGRKRINKWRGSVLPCTLVEDLQVYPTFHPSYVNRLMNETGMVISKQKEKDAQNILPLFLLDLERVKTFTALGNL